jgi:extracellular elastinolytic metalloproteinase
MNAARVNAFYVVNSIHDIAYQLVLFCLVVRTLTNRLHVLCRYGFTESTFNFQTNNFGKGGAGNDRVTISVQDAGGTNNANFATPAEYVHHKSIMWLVALMNGSLQRPIRSHE